MKSVFRNICAVAVSVAVLPILPLSVALADELTTAVAVASVGCADGQEPNLVGAVTTPSGTGYETVVTLRFTWATGSDGWAENTVLEGTTGADGQFGFCADPLELGNSIQVAAFAREGDEELFGATATPFVRSGSCAGVVCEFDIVMAEPTLLGTVVGASSVQVNVDGAFGAFVPASSEGKFSIALPISDGTPISLTALPRESTKLAFTQSYTYEGSPLLVDGSVVEPNVRVRVVDPSGNTLEAGNPSIGGFAYFVRFDGETCDPDMSEYQLWSAGCVKPGDGSPIKALLDDGEWSVVAAADNFPRTGAKFLVSDAGSSISVVSGPLEIGEGELVLTMSTGTIKFKVTEADGSPSVNIPSVSRIHSPIEMVPMWRVIAHQGSGVHGWTPQRDGVYQLSFTGDGPPLNLAVQITGAPENPEITQACFFDYGQEPVCNLDPPSLDADGLYEISLPRGNLFLVVCGPESDETNCASPIDGSTQDGNYPFEVIVSDIVIGAEGEIWDNHRDFRQSYRSGVRLALPQPTIEPGYHKIRVSPAWGNSLWAPFSLFVRTNLDGSIDRCDAATIDDLCVNPQPLADDDGLYMWPEQLHFRTSPLIVSVVKPDPCQVRCQVANARIAILKTADGEGSAVIELSADRFTDLDGRAGLSLEAGSYRLRVEPSGNETDGLSGTVAEVTIDANGLVTSIDGTETATPLDAFILSLRAPNLSGRVMAGDQASRYSSVEARRFDSQTGGFDWWNTAYSSTNSNGEFRFNLEDGVWQIIASPPWDESTVFTQTSLFVEVIDGQIARIGACVKDPNAVCDEFVEDLVVSLRQPNFRGTLKRIDPTSGELAAVNWGHISFSMKNEATGVYEWRNVTGQVSHGGNFGYRVEPGRYRIEMHAPYEMAGTVRTTKYVVVGEAGSCIAQTEEQASCETYEDTLILVYDTPNLLGRITGQGINWHGSVSFTRWTGSMFDDRLQIWEHTRDSEGNFGVRLSDGYYRARVEAHSLTGSEQGRRTLYLRVQDSTWCLTTASSGGPMECTPTETGTLEITIPSANFQADVKYSNNGTLVPLRGGGVELWRFDSGWRQWDGWYSITYNGRLALNIEHPGTWSTSSIKFELVIRPEYANRSNGLARKKIPLWLGDFDGDGEKNDLCAIQPVDGSCASPLSGLQTIELSPGNVSGRVVHPLSGVGVAGATVEAITNQCNFDANECNHWAYLPDGGRFSLPLDVGTWRISARPPWGATDVAPNQVMIHVISDSQWCLFDDFQANGAECVQPPEFDIALKSPNVSARITLNGRAISGSWVDVQRLVDEGDYSWWSHVLSGTSTNEIGRFAVFLEDGDYRLVVHPPYDNSEGAIRFSREFSVENGVDDLPDDVPFPRSNISFTLVDSAGQLVPYSYVAIEKQHAEGWWEWTENYAHSNQLGQVALRIDESGIYRMTVHPSRESATTFRFSLEFEVVVGPDGNLTFVSGDLGGQVAFPTPNVEGVVTTDGTNPSPFSGVEVTQEGRWITHHSTTELGQFGLRLADGAYTMRFHPNYRGVVSQPIDVYVVVSGDEVISWRYLSQSSDTNNCPQQGPCNIDANLSFDPPNVRFEIDVSGEAAEGAFVILTEQGGGGPISFELVSDSSGVVEAKLPQGSYSFSVVIANPDGTTVSWTSPTSIFVDGSTSTSTPFTASL